MKDGTREVLMRVLLGRGTDLDKLDMLTNMIAEKMAMSEAMADKITEGSFVSGQNILKHLLSSLEKNTNTMLETVDTWWVSGLGVVLRIRAVVL